MEKEKAAQTLNLKKKFNYETHYAVYAKYWTVLWILNDFLGSGYDFSD
jgi:hypothetical protein